MAASARDVPGAAGDPADGGVRPGAHEKAGGAGCGMCGHGLWLVRLLADQMSVTSGPDGTCVTVRFAPG